MPINNQKERMAVAANAQCPIFLRKSYHMISSCDEEIAAWSEDGVSFFVKKVETFASNILPQYFKHSNFSSFVRQLNFYGFTKAKDIRITGGDDSKLWQFRHDNFRRDSPELLVKIVRRIANQNNDPEATKVDANSQKECNQVAKEIASLQGKLKLMEDEMKKLANVMSAVSIDNDGSKTIPIPMSDDKTSQDAGSIKKRKILLKDSELFSPGVSDTVNSDPLPGLRDERSPKSSMSLSISKHAASIDLPDLGLAVTSDADLLVDDQGIASSRPSRRGSCNNGNEPLKGFSTSQSDMSIALAEEDQVIATLDLNSTMVSSDQSNAIVQELLPALIVDEGQECQQPSAKQIVRTGRNLLDSSHLLNLEKSLACLPVQDRIKFVQNIMNDISGLDDLLKQGLTVVAKCDTDEGGGMNKPSPTSLSRARQVIESGIDTSLLSELESLLSRVGLRIQINTHEQAARCASSSKKSKDSSYVEIEA